jgi:hypothetical protein
VVSEKPYVVIDHSVPGAKIAAAGETSVDTVQGPSFKHSTGKGGMQVRLAVVLVRAAAAAAAWSLLATC